MINKKLCRILLLFSLVPFTQAGAQDTLVTISGRYDLVKILEVAPKFIRFHFSGSPDTSEYLCSVDSVAFIKYQKGSTENFNKPIGSLSCNNKKTKLPDITDTTTLAIQDAHKFYVGCGPCVTGTIFSTILGAIIGGLPVAVVCSATPPDDVNLYYPNAQLLKVPQYEKAYKKEAYKIKKRTTWTAFGITAGIETILVGIIFGLGSIKY